MSHLLGAKEDALRKHHDADAELFDKMKELCGLMISLGITQAQLAPIAKKNSQKKRQ